MRTEAEKAQAQIGRWQKRLESAEELIRDIIAGKYAPPAEPSEFVLRCRASALWHIGRAKVRLSRALAPNDDEGTLS